VADDVKRGLTPPFFQVKPMMQLIAKSFVDQLLGSVEIGQLVNVPNEIVARDYIRRDLLARAQQRPTQPAGTQLSASPAGQVSPQTTAKKLKRGRPPKVVLE
jgi:hypothetical protein